MRKRKKGWPEHYLEREMMITKARGNTVGS